MHSLVSKIWPGMILESAQSLMSQSRKIGLTEDMELTLFISGRLLI